MADWVRGIDPKDVTRVEIVRVTLAGRPSYVTHATFALHLRDGSVLTKDAVVVDKMYETLRADVAAANRLLRGP